MRIYKDFKDALPEIKRDLVEMGVKIHTRTYQDKVIADDPNFESLELQNYIYTVTNPNPAELNPVQPWADAEFEERMSGLPLNPGEAWKLRPEVWTQFLEKLPLKTAAGDDQYEFAYSYPERMYDQFLYLVQKAKEDINSRQLFLSIWDKNKDPDNIGGAGRVPCSLGYLFQIRKGRVNMSYMMRSSDYATHLNNDVYLAVRTQQRFAEEMGLPLGMFTQFIGSLHIFKKDSEGVF